LLSFFLNPTLQEDGTGKVALYGENKKLDRVHDEDIEVEEG